MRILRNNTLACRSSSRVLHGAACASKFASKMKTILSCADEGCSGCKSQDKRTDTVKIDFAVAAAAEAESKRLREEQERQRQEKERERQRQQQEQQEKERRQREKLRQEQEEQEKRRIAADQQEELRRKQIAAAQAEQLRKEEEERQAAQKVVEAKQKKVQDFLTEAGFQSINEQKKKAGLMSSSHLYPLHAAVKAKNSEAVKLLIWSKADATLQDSGKKTPMALALKLDKNDSHKAVIAALGGS